MNQDHYLRLMERMNQNDLKHSVSDAMLDLLRELFTEDQAALIGDFPFGAYTVSELSKVMGRDEASLDIMLKDMSDNGLIFEAQRENGDKEYSVLPFEPGLLELQFIKGKDDERTRKFVKMMGKVTQHELTVIDGILNEPDLARQAFSVPTVRVVAVEEAIADDKEIASWEKVSALVEGESSYAVGECSCKHITRINGTPCQSEGPSKCCVWFGKVADYMVEGGYATRLSKEELYVLLKKCEDAGLVHMTGNRLHKTVLCNCCKCCCAYLKANKRIRQAGIEFAESSNFVVRLNEETCIGCGQCVAYCQLEALQLSGDAVTINPVYCRGCGACVSKCPTQSLSLVRISNKKPSVREIPVVGAGV